MDEHRTADEEDLAAGGADLAHPLRDLPNEARVWLFWRDAASHEGEDGGLMSRTLQRLHADALVAHYD